MRLQYPTNVKIVRVPCTGKVDVIHIMRAFEKGADGVAVIVRDTQQKRAAPRVNSVTTPGADTDLYAR